MTRSLPEIQTAEGATFDSAYVYRYILVDVPLRNIAGGTFSVNHWHLDGKQTGLLRILIDHAVPA